MSTYEGRHGADSLPSSENSQSRHSSRARGAGLWCFQPAGGGGNRQLRGACALWLRGLPGLLGGSQGGAPLGWGPQTPNIVGLFCKVLDPQDSPCCYSWEKAAAQLRMGHGVNGRKNPLRAGLESSDKWSSHSVFSPGKPHSDSLVFVMDQAKAASFSCSSQGQLGLAFCEESGGRDTHIALWKPGLFTERPCW